MKAEWIQNGLVRLILLIGIAFSGFLFILNLFMDGYTIAYVHDVRFIYGGSLIGINGLTIFLIFLKKIIQWFDQHHKMTEPFYYGLIILITVVIIQFANC